jgi:general secretion pathway protein G
VKYRQAGFSLLEAMVAASMLAIFAGLLLNRMHYYQEMAEKTNMEATVKALQSGLRYEMARALMAGQEIDYQRLANENPMNWLDQKPPNYLGEFSHNAESLTRGAWYFDPHNRELVYLPALDGHFVPDRKGQIRVRYRVELRAGKDASGIVTARLKEIEAYTWF